MGTYRQRHGELPSKVGKLILSLVIFFRNLDVNYISMLVVVVAVILLHTYCYACVRVRNYSATESDAFVCLLYIL